MATLNQQALRQAPSVAPAPKIRPFEPGIADRWDRFVREEPRASFFHLIGWKRVMEKTFDYQPCYFYAERQGEITGIAPVFLVSNWVVGRCLVSLPLAVYGGVCARDKESEQLLVSRLKQFAVAQQVQSLELRNRNGGLLEGCELNPRYVTFTTQLLSDPESNWKRLPRDTRYMIRKAQKAGLRTRRGLDQLEIFYRLFAISMRRVGTPVFPQVLFENLIEEFQDQMDLLVVYAVDQPVSGVLSFLFRDAILPYYAGATDAARPLAANNFMYWELMREAAQAGTRTFDFGRSRKGTGAYAFKSQWGMEVESLDYQFFLVKRKAAPNFSPSNPKFRLAAQLWRQLPLKVTSWMGPRVVQWFP